MSKLKHAQEPWYNDDDIIRQTGTDAQIAIVTYDEGGNPHEDIACAARIVACVNSAKFVSNEWLQSNSVNALIESERESKMKVEALLHALKTIQLRYNESFLKEHQELIAKAISYATN